MRRSWWLVIVFLLTGCGGPAATVPPTAPPMPATVVALAHFTIGQTGTSVGVSAFLDAVRDPVAPTAYYHPDAGMRYYGIDLSITNSAQRALTISAADAPLRGSDNREYPVTRFLTAPPLTPVLDGQVLQPGETVRGWLLYTLPTAVRAVTWRYQPTRDDAPIIFDL